MRREVAVIVKKPDRTRPAVEPEPMPDAVRFAEKTVHVCEPAKTGQTGWFSIKPSENRGSQTVNRADLDKKNLCQGRINGELNRDLLQGLWHAFHAST